MLLQIHANAYASQAYIRGEDIGDTALAACNCGWRGQGAKEPLKLQADAHQQAILPSWGSHLQPIWLPRAVKPNGESQCCIPSKR